jgi:hypothetical protein
MTYTVEAATLPVVDEGGWEILRRVLDTVPGTILVEDPQRPTLVFAVDESSPARAMAFVEGVSKLMGFSLTGGVVGPVPDDDYPADLFGADDGDVPEPSDEVVRAHRYAEAVPETVPAR